MIIIQYVLIIDYYYYCCYYYNYYWWWFLFRWFFLFNVLSECNPYTLDSHGVGCLANLISLLTVPVLRICTITSLTVDVMVSILPIILLDVLVYYSCTYVDDLPSCSIVTGTQSGDLHTCSCSLWLLLDVVVTCGHYV